MTQTTVTASTTLSNAFLAHATDSGGSPLPSATEAIPNSPPVNYTLSGVLTNVGDVFTTVFNQQIVNPDGSLTVNGMHMYLFGPTAIGEMVRGQVNCGTTPSPLAASDTVLPTCGVPVVEPVGPDDPHQKSPHTQLIGTFDAGTGAPPSGIKSITNAVATNGTVQIGNPSGFPYQQFTVGQTGPLQITATRNNAAETAGLTMTWGFDVTDNANNVTHCSGVPESPPVAGDDKYRTPKNAPLTVASPGLLDNDADPNGNHLSAGSASDPPNGTVTVNANGSFTYTPDAGFTGYDTFTYVTTDVSGTGAGTDTGLVTIRVGVAPTADFDGNGSTDIGVFRPGDSTWYVRNQPPDTTFGTTGDIPVPADYDAQESTADFAVFRPSNGGWYSTGLNPIGFGTNGDIPVPGDYNGDGFIDRAVFRPSQGVWYVRNGTPAAIGFGISGDIPVPGDYDGNGKTDIAVFRPSQGVWYINGGAATAWGTNGDIPVPADYNNDGKTDIAVFRPSQGVWYVQGVSNTGWGISGDIPAPGDYDNNGTTDLAVFRPSTGTWFVNGGITANYGGSGDYPLPLPSAIRRVFFP